MGDLLGWLIKNKCIRIKDSQGYNMERLGDVDYIVRHEAVQKMRVGPSESACRSRLQTT